MIVPLNWLLAIATPNLFRPPAKRGSLGRPTVCKLRRIIDKAVPPPRENLRRAGHGGQLSEAFGPCPGQTSVEFGDGAPLVEVIRARSRYGAYVVFIVFVVTRLGGIFWLPICF